MSWEIMELMATFTLTLILAQLATTLTGIIRTRDFQRLENQSRDRIARQFPIAFKYPSAAEDFRTALKPLVDTAHDAANVPQTRYHNAVARSAGCLVLTFLALVVSSFSHQVWPLHGRPKAYTCSNRSSLGLT